MSTSLVRCNYAAKRSSIVNAILHSPPVLSSKKAKSTLPDAIRFPDLGDVSILSTVPSENDEPILGAPQVGAKLPVSATGTPNDSSLGTVLDGKWINFSDLGDVPATSTVPSENDEPILGAPQAGANGPVYATGTPESKSTNSGSTPAVEISDPNFSSVSAVKASNIGTVPALNVSILGALPPNANSLVSATGMATTAAFATGVNDPDFVHAVAQQQGASGVTHPTQQLPNLLCLRCKRPPNLCGGVGVCVLESNAFIAKKCASSPLPTRALRPLSYSLPLLLTHVLCRASGRCSAARAARPRVSTST